MERTWAIPDIHGCLETLKLLIFQQIVADKKDHLVFLGDYIDRGPDGKGVLDFIMELEGNGYQITALAGNHESVCLKAYDECKKIKKPQGLPYVDRYQQHWFALGGIRTLRSFHAKSPDDIPEKYIDWMRSRDFYIELDDFFAVHAGFNFDGKDPFSDTESMIWIRNYVVDPDKTNNKKVIHGHTPVPLAIIKQNIADKDALSINLDNGIYLPGYPGYGNLVALELNNMEYKVQKVVDKVNYF